ncbi:MAG: type II toxin-antitoxin system prevent-host-death family antitoxin [Alphaproteobacteria bacterium]|nr:type II toxin-antitoxin system prevent-host-death family antitoxin [Alphaproteobacteria bacterium]
MALSGEEVVIMKAGQPVVRLVAYPAAVPPRAGLAKGQLTRAFFEPLDESELAAWDQ